MKLVPFLLGIRAGLDDRAGVTWLHDPAANAAYTTGQRAARALRPFPATSLGAVVCVTVLMMLVVAWL